jgi:hypothetical protein
MKKKTVRDHIISQGLGTLQPDGRVLDINGECIDFRCDDCRKDTSTIGEYYWLHDHVWAQANADGVLCIGCFERRLGRQLTREDFDLTEGLNQSLIMHQSKRLKDRLGGGAFFAWKPEQPTGMDRLQVEAALKAHLAKGE